MSCFRTLDWTTCTTAVSNAVSRPFLTFLCPALHIHSSRRGLRQSAVARPAKGRPLPNVGRMDNLFIQALARAGSCPKHAKQISTLQSASSTSTGLYKKRPKGTLHNERRGYSSTMDGRRGPVKRLKAFAENEFKALVDYYDIDLNPEIKKEEEKLKVDGPLVWNVGDDHIPWPVSNPQMSGHIQAIEELLENEESPHDELFAAYKRLPSPGVVYLKTETIRRLLHHFSVVERKNEVSMQRFLSMLDDMKYAHIHITRSEWTSAIHFAGRCMGRVRGDEVQAALRIWSDMERRAGVKAGPVTLQVLFDVAVKAEKFALAETYLSEMRHRGYEFHRHFRVSMLYYHGVLQNGNGVRKTYKELVEAGDIVDTAVMNAVIAALIRAGEPSAAESVFERMKRLHAKKTNPGTSPRTWRERRRVGLDLTWRARQYAKAEDTDSKDVLQDSAPILPDSRTYGLLIRYQASIAGDIDRVTELLEEMQHNSVPLEGTIFIVIIYGFSKFGGVPYSSWTRDRLEPVWATYLQSVEQRLPRTFFSAPAVIASLKAFNKCADHERTLKAWEEVRRIWEPKPVELERVLKALRKMLPEHSYLISG